MIVRNITKCRKSEKGPVELEKGLVELESGDDIIYHSRELYIKQGDNIYRSVNTHAITPPTVGVKYLGNLGDENFRTHLHRKIGSEWKPYKPDAR